MNAALLLEHYARIADAPDAIARLRRFVLELAVRGKLVEQKSKGSPAESPDAPYAIPSEWQWRRIGDELELLNGMAFKPTDWVPSGLPIVRIQNLNNPLAPFNFCDPAKARDRSLIDDGAFLISWSGTPGTSFGAFIWQRGAAVLNQHIFRCDFKTQNFDVAFLRLAINGRLDEMIAKAHGGVGLQHITKGKLEAMLIALPPLAEQHRIVAKVDELMALCDQLDAERVCREAKRDKLTAASLARLNVPDPEAFAHDARFTLDNLAPLTTRKDQIKDLRQTILNLAVRGKLVEQDSADEPAAQLLERLRGRATGPRRSGAKSTDINAVDGPFDVPMGWAWATVQQVLDARREISYGVIKLGDEPKAGGIPTLRCSDVRPGYIDLSGVRRVREDIEAAYERTRLSGGEIVINIRGTLGGVAVVPPQLSGFNVAREVAVVPISIEVSGAFIAHLMLSPYFWEHIQNNLRGIAYKGLNLGILRELPIPLPPLAEQHRIVAKVDELMALCDQLETSLTTGEQTRSRLLESVLHNALEPA